MLGGSSTSSNNPRSPLRGGETELAASIAPRRSNESSSSSPQLIYCVVARERTLLAEYSFCSGNFATVTRILLEKISPTPYGQRKSYTYDNYVFHYTTSAGLTYVCLADREMGQSVPMRFLDEICGRFESSFLSASKTAIALQLNNDFQPIMRSTMDKYNDGAANDSMERIRGHIAEISDNMIDNIDKIMQRQEKIELLVEKTESLNRTALQFRRQAVNVRRTLWWRDVRAKATIIVIAVTIIFLIVMWLCGGIYFDKCRSN
jgi:vesicle-associated membrane protein 7